MIFADQKFEAVLLLVTVILFENGQALHFLGSFFQFCKNYKKMEDSHKRLKVRTIREAELFLVISITIAKPIFIYIPHSVILVLIISIRIAAQQKMILSRFSLPLPEEHEEEIGFRGSDDSESGVYRHSIPAIYFKHFKDKNKPNNRPLGNVPSLLQKH